MKTQKVEIEITPAMAKRLRQLVRTGLYGPDLPAAARRILEGALRSQIPIGLTR